VDIEDDPTENVERVAETQREPRRHQRHRGRIPYEMWDVQPPGPDLPSSRKVCIFIAGTMRVLLREGSAESTSLDEP
jgi:hypothetical protein